MIENKFRSLTEKEKNQYIDYCEKYWKDIIINMITSDNNIHPFIKDILKTKIKINYER